MTEEFSDDVSIELRLSEDGWDVAEATSVDAEVAKAMADGTGNGRLTVNYQPDE